MCHKLNKIYLDFDGVIVNTIKAICDLYNEDFVAYKKYKPIKWIDVETWDFTELEASTPEYINHYFNQPRFFEKLEFIDNFLDFYKCVLKNYDVTIVSSGYSPNLKLKEEWINNNLPECKFIGVNLKEYKDKSHIDMSGGIFIDDSYSNLVTSNADIHICFGELYEWNKLWGGTRCYNWFDVWDFFTK